MKPENYTCENLHAAIRSGGIPRSARHVGVMQDDVETLILCACPLCRSSIAYVMPDPAMLPMLGLEVQP